MHKTQQSIYHLVRPFWLPVAAFLMTAMVHGAAHAQTVGKIIGKDGITSRPLILMTALAALALVPFVLIMVTSFVKIAVVLSIVRQAVGTQQIPPTQVITGMAIILTVYIMMPVGLEVYHQANTLINQKTQSNRVDKSRTADKSAGQIFADLNVDEILGIGKLAQVPMRDFLIKHAHLKDRDMFYKLTWRMRKPRDRAELTDKDWTVIIPSFVISELKEAFQIGFILFVPFLVVDMVVANILMALGMQMLSPTTISLPFKILLFVLVDGWYLITKGLVIGYQ